MPNGLHTVEQFAKALDREAYGVARSLLADECDYTCRGTRHHGPAEIIASHQGNGEDATSVSCHLAVCAPDIVTGGI